MPQTKQQNKTTNNCKIPRTKQQTKQQNTILSQQPPPPFKQNVTNKTKKQIQMPQQNNKQNNKQNATTKQQIKCHNKTTNKMVMCVLRFVYVHESRQRSHSVFCRDRSHLELLWEFTSRIPPAPGLRSPLVVRGVVRCLACGVRLTTSHIATTTMQTKCHKQKQQNKTTKHANATNKMPQANKINNRTNATNKTTNNMSQKVQTIV